MVASKVVIDIIIPNLRTRNAVEFALQQQGKGRFEMSRGNRPELVIVDCEKPDTRADLRKFRRRFPGCPAILLLNLAAEYDEFPADDRTGAEFLLIKPFAVKDLIAAVDQCLGSTAAKQAGSNTGPGGSAGPAAPGEHARIPAQSDQRNTSHLIARIGSKVAASEAVSVPPVKAAREEITEKLPQGFTTRAKKSVRLPSNQTAARPRVLRHAGVAHAEEDVAFPFVLQSDIDLSDAAAVERIRLNVDSKLLGHVTRALAKQVAPPSTTRLALPDGTSIYISPHTKMVATAAGNMNLLELATRDFADSQVSLSAAAIPETGAGMQLGLDAFLWKLALYTYRGLLPEGVNVNEPVYLKCWPNLTRLEPTPNAMRISSLWCRQPTNLAVIIRMLNIPQRHVFAFYAAASTVGLAGRARREADHLLVPVFPGEGRENHTLIRRLASKLTFPDDATS